MDFLTRKASGWLAAATCCLALGCGLQGSQTGIREAGADKAIPPEVLAPEFFRTLQLTIYNDYGRTETPKQPLEYGADAPESKRARELLLRLLTRDDIPRLRATGLRKEPMRIYYSRSRSEKEVFAICVQPVIGYRVQVYCRPEPGEVSQVVREYSCDKRMLKEFEDLWAICTSSQVKGP